MKLLNFLLKYWKIVLFCGAALWFGIVWVLEVDDHVENAPTAEERKLEKQSIDLNNAHAIEIRQMRFDNQIIKDSIAKIYERKKDSIDKVYEFKKDSTFFDKIDRQTVQMEQMKVIIEQIKNHNE